MGCGCVQSNVQLEGAFEFLGSVGEQPVDWSRLEEAAGVGVVVSLHHLPSACWCLAVEWLGGLRNHMCHI